MKVLFIEDDLALRRIITAAAKQKNVVILGAKSIDEAREALKKKPDLIWTDIGLPGGERGIDILQEAPGEIPACICTGYQRGVLTFKRYWKYIEKRAPAIAGYGAVSIMIRMLHAARCLHAIAEERDDPAMGVYASNEISSKISDEQKYRIESLFARETECLDLWLEGKRGEAAVIAAGLLDGSLC